MPATVVVFLVSGATAQLAQRVKPGVLIGAGLSLIGGEPIFSAKDPNNAYGQLVNRLVYAVTYDLRSTWVKQ